MTIVEILEQTLIEMMDVPDPTPQKRRLSELRGLGKEIWQAIDAQEYVNRLCSEWDHQP
jgi:hypothetical protein